MNLESKIKQYMVEKAFEGMKKSGELRALKDKREAMAEHITIDSSEEELKAIAELTVDIMDMQSELQAIVIVLEDMKNILGIESEDVPKEKVDVVQ